MVSTQSHRLHKRGAKGDDIRLESSSSKRIINQVAAVTKRRFWLSRTMKRFRRRARGMLNADENIKIILQKWNGVMPRGVSHNVRLITCLLHFSVMEMWFVLASIGFRRSHMHTDVYQVKTPISNVSAPELKRNIAARRREIQIPPGKRKQIKCSLRSMRLWLVALWLEIVNPDGEFFLQNKCLNILVENIFSD